jgi:quercetin dioxygenase-like cupin family protein
MLPRWLFSIALAGCFALGWFAHAVTAQGHTPVTVTRLYTGSDGQTHAEETTDIRLTSDPARRGLETSENIKVTGLQFVRTSPGWVVDWHPADRHQYIVTLSGRGEIEVSGGRKIALEPGSIVLAEDATGKGHISRTVGTEDRVALNIQVADR